MPVLKRTILSFYRSIWFFPTILLIVVIALSALQINGSSVGVYYKLFYGDTAKDPNLLFNQPRGIRSDEWLVTTPLSLAQTKTNFSAINPNIGNGGDVSLLVDAPTLDFIQVFKPHNLGYFFLPSGNAFSLKWWLLAYFLLISVYFFILTVMPKKKLFAIIASIAFAASPFIFWWYQYITLAPIYYSLFIAVVAIKIKHSRTYRGSILWATLLSYLITSFIVILYPPFQIPCALTMAAFLVGYYLDNKPKTKTYRKRLLIGCGVAGALSIFLIALCLVPKLPIIEVIANTSYPGQRTVRSGSMNAGLFLSSNLSILTQNDSRASNYKWLGNQSGGSNFLLVFILLLPALLYLIIKYRRKIDNFYTVLCVLVVSLLFFAWLFIPNIDLLGKATLLDRVPQIRLFIGFGLINLLVIMFFTQIYNKIQVKLPTRVIVAYSLTIFIFYILLNMYIHHLFPLFIGTRWALLLAIPYALICYLVLSRQTMAATLAFLAFSIISVWNIHPLYHGVSTITDSQISKAIQSVDKSSSKKWAVDSMLLENLPVVSGKRSLSGTYVYPQKTLYEQSFPKQDTSKYNRYAHTYFAFDRDGKTTIKRSLTQPAEDQLAVPIEPCDPYLKNNDVGYLLVMSPITKDEAACTTQIKTVQYPNLTLYIYSLSF